MLKVVIKSMGCKANRYESDRIQDKFEDMAIFADAQIHDMRNADVIIVNTCTVTHAADRKSRQAITVLKKNHPTAKVVVFGCGANTDPESYTNLDQVDFVVQKREEIDELIEELIEEKKKDPKNGNEAACETSNFEINRTRTFVKIQDGCNNFCAYCIIPYARGRQVSYPSEQIITEIKRKIDKGFKEVVLTGINIGMWKENSNDLADLIQMILDKTSIERLRLSSIEPQNYSDKFIELFKNPRFCPYLHISLQSGSAEILKNMRRHYKKELFADIVARLRKAVPHFSITTDVIVGFPGETDELFEETCEFVKEMNFSKIHIFPYSKREGTPAAEMPNQINPNIKKERCSYLANIENNMRMDFYKKNTGRIEEVLFEANLENGFHTGFTSNYLRVRLNEKSKEDLTNQTRKVKLLKLSENETMICKIIDIE
ncbi:tRNA (N(6)-L-threonylcarbamoyladenosine(37)-C(2))-methylthiotransferase MtaB [Patescibacteria group bacterium]|nr:tRNA (N(6)-L-threonylcarbamoyladenosine(37)-C(2))-methylthiotransferase MtaB [Patescibacteria group bacterium]